MHCIPVLCAIKRKYAPFDSDKAFLSLRIIHKIALISAHLSPLPFKVKDMLKVKSSIIMPSWHPMILKAFLRKKETGKWTLLKRGRIISKGSYGYIMEYSFGSILLKGGKGRLKSYLDNFNYRARMKVLTVS
jgi:hypothetical protein